MNNDFVLGRGHLWYTTDGKIGSRFTRICLVKRRHPIDEGDVIPMRGVGSYGSWEKGTLIWRPDVERKDK
jgi:hypothetical protein